MGFMGTSQEEDPNGLQAVADLIDNGTDDNFETQVSDRLPQIGRVKNLLERVQHLTPGIEFSPYVMRMINIADKVESSRMEKVSA
jgi:hypothetical protein